MQFPAGVTFPAGHRPLHRSAAAADARAVHVTGHRGPAGVKARGIGPIWRPVNTVTSDPFIDPPVHAHPTLGEIEASDVILSGFGEGSTPARGILHGVRHSGSGNRWGRHPSGGSCRSRQSNRRHAVDDKFGTIYIAVHQAAIGREVLERHPA
jgi:hypothetical protein